MRSAGTDTLTHGLRLISAPTSVCEASLGYPHNPTLRRSFALPSNSPSFRMTAIVFPIERRLSVLGVTFFLLLSKKSDMIILRKNSGLYKKYIPLINPIMIRLAGNAPFPFSGFQYMRYRGNRQVFYINLRYQMFLAIDQCTPAKIGS
jgi:hypothetical protein